jgi:hypothetical protein
VQERRKRRQQRALQSYNDRPRVLSPDRAYEAGVGVGPAEAVLRHLRGGSEDGLCLLQAYARQEEVGEAEGMELLATGGEEDWYDKLRTSDDDIDPEELLRNAIAEQQRRQDAELQEEELSTPADD